MNMKHPNYILYLKLNGNYDKIILQFKLSLINVKIFIVFLQLQI